MGIIPYLKVVQDQSCDVCCGYYSHKINMILFGEQWEESCRVCPSCLKKGVEMLKGSGHVA